MSHQNPELSVSTATYSYSISSGILKMEKILSRQRCSSPVSSFLRSSIAFSIDFFIFGLWRSFSLSLGCFFKFSSDTDSDFRWAYQLLQGNFVISYNLYDMEHTIGENLGVR